MSLGQSGSVLLNKKQISTIKDVAALARVSQMTVSRVLNNRTSVKESTRLRVQEAMRELNYRPNIMARNLAGRAGLFIGLVYRNPSYGYLSEFLLGALGACRQLGHYLIVEEPLLDQEVVDLEEIEKRFLDTSIQALIVVPPLSDDPHFIDTLERTGISFVRVSPTLDEYKGLGVGMDDASAACEMTEYLLDLGHEDVAIIKGPPDHIASRLRFSGYQRAYEKRGKTLDDSAVLSGDFTYLSGMEATRVLLARETPPTAIFACNDDMAAGAIAAAHQAGLNIPEDISIVGFDDTENAASMWPPLTTIRQPIRDMARSAILLLENAFEDWDSPDQAESDKRILDYELIVRGSAAAPKKAR